MRISLTFLEVLDPDASPLVSGSKNIQHDGIMNNLTRDKEMVLLMFSYFTKRSRLAGYEQMHNTQYSRYGHTIYICDPGAQKQS